MKGFFDTSVLVPVFYGNHVHHRALTRMPGKRRISAEQAILFIGSVRERLSIIALSGDEYANALQTCSARGIVCGGIYDAVPAHCAIKAQAEAIYTWNARHYALCAPEVTHRLRMPVRVAADTGHHRLL